MVLWFFFCSVVVVVVIMEKVNGLVNESRNVGSDDGVVCGLVEMVENGSGSDSGNDNDDMVVRANVVRIRGSVVEVRESSRKDNDGGMSSSFLL